jgi:hypothetical protein
MARPKKKICLEHIVGVRMSSKDHADAQARAQACGLPLSVWLREAAFGRPLARARPTVNQEVWGMLGRLIATLSLFKENAGRVKPEHFAAMIDFVGRIREKLSQ